VNALIARVRKRKKPKPKKRKISLRKLTRKRLIKAIDNSYGNVGVIADRLGVTYNTVYNAIIVDGSEEIQDLFEREHERMFDLGERGIVEMAGQSLHFPTKLHACKFIVTHHPKANGRAYKERKQLTIEGGDKPVQIETKNVVALADLRTIPLDVRKQMLEEMEGKEDG